MSDSDDDDGGGGALVLGGKGKLKRSKAICRHRRLSPSLPLSLPAPLFLSSLHYSLKYASIYQGAKERVSDGLGGRAEKNGEKRKRLLNLSIFEDSKIGLNQCVHGREGGSFGAPNAPIK